MRVTVLSPPALMRRVRALGGGVSMSTAAVRWPSAERVAEAVGGAAYLGRIGVALPPPEDIAPMRIELGRMAKLADGQACVAIAQSMVLSTCVSSRQAARFGDESAVVGLTVDYRLRSASAGRAARNRLNRDMAPSDAEILTGRLVDRCLRPLFPADFSHQVQLTCTVLSALSSGRGCVDVAAVNGAMAALAASAIPFGWDESSTSAAVPAAAVRLALSADGNLSINGDVEGRRGALLDAVVAMTRQGNVLMLDVTAKQVRNETLMGCVRAAGIYVRRVVDAADEAVARVARSKYEWSAGGAAGGESLRRRVRSVCGHRISDVLLGQGPQHGKASRDAALQAVRSDALPHFTQTASRQPEAGTVAAEAPDGDDGDRSAVDGGDSDSAPTVPQFNAAFYANVRQIYREQILSGERRCDGRSAGELRPIACEADALPAVHGSALFERGFTQVLCTVALDSLDARQMNTFLDEGGETEPGDKPFVLNYIFPQYANNRIDTGRRPSRRELGHGALAHRALAALVDARSETPFAVHVTAEVLASNGSSSMATVCAACLALMDAGVPVSHMVSGVAIGMVSDEQSGKSVLLADLLGFEDFVGDMDVKVAGTVAGVTAVQLDCKLRRGVPEGRLADALQLAHRCNGDIMQLMAGQLSASRPALKPCGPVVDTLVVPAYKRRDFVGPAGCNLRLLHHDHNVTLYQSDERPDTWHVHAANAQCMRSAKAHIERILSSAAERRVELEFGATYKVKITEIRDNGVLVTLGGGASASDLFVPLHQLGAKRVLHPSYLGLRVGDEIHVRYFGRDPATGRHRVSRKSLLLTRSRTVDTVRKRPAAASSPWLGR